MSTVPLSTFLVRYTPAFPCRVNASNDPICSSSYPKRSGLVLRAQRRPGRLSLSHPGRVRPNSFEGGTYWYPGNHLQVTFFRGLVSPLNMTFMKFILSFYLRVSNFAVSLERGEIRHNTWKQVNHHFPGKQLGGQEG